MCEVYRNNIFLRRWAVGQFVDVEVVDLKMSPEVFGLFVCLSPWILFKQLRPKNEFSPNKTLCEKNNVGQQIIF